MPRTSALVLCALGGAAALVVPPRAARRPALHRLRAAWEQHTDAASGNPYWHDADTGATTWDDPAAPVVDPYADWQAAADPAGTTYYYTADGRTSWEWPPVAIVAEAPADDASLALEEAARAAADDASVALAQAAQKKADRAAALKVAAERAAAKQADGGAGAAATETVAVPPAAAADALAAAKAADAERGGGVFFQTRLAQAVAKETVAEAVPEDAVETEGPQAIKYKIGEGNALDDLGAMITQRSVQTQLQYNAALRNEPQVSWLSKFLGHDHLGPKLRDTGSAGPPASYTPALGQLRGPWIKYLETLGSTPDDVVEVELAQPANRFSERQKKNPFLMAQALKSMFYEEPIDTRWILHRLLRTADALIESWSFHYGVLEREDRERVERDDMPVKALPSTDMNAAEQLKEGGETVYGQEDAMPLASFDRRLCDRVATLRALDLLDKELDALAAAPDVIEAVAATPYLRLNYEVELRDDCQDEKILAKRADRKARLEAAFKKGTESDRAQAAVQGGKLFLAKFRETWAPRLNAGSRLSDLEKHARRRPGLKAPRQPGVGADAEEVMEELWYFQDRYAFGVDGGELVLPGRMGHRVRELRADVAVACRTELAQDVEPVRARLAKELPEVDEALGSRTQSLTAGFTIADSTKSRQESVDAPSR